MSLDSWETQVHCDQDVQGICTNHIGGWYRATLEGKRGACTNENPTSPLHQLFTYDNSLNDEPAAVALELQQSPHYSYGRGDRAGQVVTRVLGDISATPHSNHNGQKCSSLPWALLALSVSGCQLHLQAASSEIFCESRGPTAAPDVS